MALLPPKRCIICLNYLRPEKKLTPQHSLQEQVQIIYFLRRLAWRPISDEDLKTLLHLGNPSEWAALCHICEEDVKRCLEMHEAVAKIIGQITDIRKKLYENFFEVEGEENGGQAGTPDMIVFNQIRRRLFSEFKEKGQETGAFDKSVKVSYSKAGSSSDNDNADAAVSTSTVTSAPQKTLSTGNHEDQDQDDPGTFDADWGDTNDGDIEDSYLDSESGQIVQRNPESPHCSSTPAPGVDCGRLKDEPSSSTQEGEKEPEPEFILNPTTGRLTEKKPKRQFDWDIVRSFGSWAEAKAHIKAEKTWTIRYKRDLLEGRKIFYSCLHGRDCSAKIYVFLQEQDSNIIVDLYSTNLPHDHLEPLRKVGLTEYEKLRINDIYANGITYPKKIFDALQNEGLMEPTMGQVIAYVYYNLKRKEREPPPKGLFGPKRNRGRPKRKDKEKQQQQGPSKDIIRSLSLMTSSAANDVYPHTNSYQCNSELKLEWDGS